MDISGRLRIYRQRRKTFSIRTFLLAALFIIMTGAQWLPMLLVDDLKDFLKEHYYISFIAFICGLFASAIFIFHESVRFMLPFNWILSFLIVECAIWGFGRAIIESATDHFAYSFAAVTLLVILVIIIGAYCPYDITVDIVLLFIGCIILFVAAVFFVMLHAIAAVPYAIYFYLTFVNIMVIMFLLYHTQTIFGGRYAEMRIADYLLAALIIYHDFVILFVLTFFLITRMNDTNYNNNYRTGEPEEIVQTAITATTTKPTTITTGRENYSPGRNPPPVGHHSGPPK